MKLRKYRIVTDSYAGYEAQSWCIWFPFWLQMGGENSHATVKDAERYIKKHKRAVVKYVEI